MSSQFWVLGSQFSVLSSQFSVSVLSSQFSEMQRCTDGCQRSSQIGVLTDTSAIWPFDTDRGGFTGQNWELGALF